MSFIGKIGSVLDRTIMRVIRHGKLECYTCGVFYPKGEPNKCNCREKK